MKNKTSLKKLFNNLVIKISLTTIILSLLILLSWILWINHYPRDYYHKEYQPTFTKKVQFEFESYDNKPKIDIPKTDEQFSYVILKDGFIYEEKGDFKKTDINKLAKISFDDSFVQENTMYSFVKLDTDQDVKILMTYPAFSTGNRIIDKFNAGYQIFLIAGPFLIFIYSLQYFTKKLHNKIETDLKIIESNLKKIEQGDLEHSLPKLDNKEFNELSSKIDEMRVSLKETLEKLENQFSIQKHLFSSIAHDVRTPLTIISAESEMLELEVNSEKVKRRSQIIFSEVEQIDSLLTELLKFISLNSNQYSLKLQKFDLNKMIDLLINDFSSIALKKAVSMTLFTDNCENKIVSDFSMLNRVFSNIITNALDHTTTKGEISIIINNDLKNIRIIIENTGSQFPDNIISKDFIPLTVKEKSNHFGLGLYMSNVIISNLNGKLSLSNEKNNARVIIDLPHDLTSKIISN